MTIKVLSVGGEEEEPHAGDGVAVGEDHDVALGGVEEIFTSLVAFLE